MRTFISDPSVFFSRIIDETTEVRIIEVTLEWEITGAGAINHLQIIQGNITLKASTSDTLENDLEEESKGHSTLLILRQFRCPYAVFIGDIG